MDTTKIEIPKAKATELYNEYSEAVKSRKEKVYADLKKVYKALSIGHKVIDIFEAFKQSGLNKDGEPKLAIARADWGSVIFVKEQLGSGTFTDRGKWDARRECVILPINSFAEWKTEKVKNFSGNLIDRVKREEIETKVPIVPPYLLPIKGSGLSNYYILFEATEWSVPRRRAAGRGGDPYLLRRINSNAFIVLAEWDVTEVEQAVMRGL